MRSLQRRSLVAARQNSCCDSGGRPEPTSALSKQNPGVEQAKCDVREFLAQKRVMAPEKIKALLTVVVEDHTRLQLEYKSLQARLSLVQQDMDTMTDFINNVTRNMDQGSIC